MYNVLQEAISYYVKDSKRVLDICAGTGRWLDDFKGIKCAVELNPKYHPILLEKGYRLRDEGDAAKLPYMINTVYYDTIMCIDGIEHLSETEGLELIKWCERSGKTILFFTPNEFDSNEINANNLGEPLQTHKSVWPETFWTNRGYIKVYSEFNSDSKVHNNLYVLVTTKTL